MVGGLVAKLYLTLTIPWTVAHQAPLSMGFSRQEYWSVPSPGDLPHPGIKPRSPAPQADSLPSELPGKLLLFIISSVQVSRSVVSDSLRPHESQHARPPCPSPTPGVHSDSHPSSPHTIMSSPTGERIKWWHLNSGKFYTLRMNIPQMYFWANKQTSKITAKQQ